MVDDLRHGRMPWRGWRGWLRRLSARLRPFCGSVRAELLSELFPDWRAGLREAPGVTVASRARPEYDPQGVRVGISCVYPQWMESLGYDRQRAWRWSCAWELVARTRGRRCW